MTDPQELETEIAGLRAAMREKLGVRAGTLQQAHTSAKRLLPRRVYRSFALLEKAEPYLAHPKLSRTLDHKALTAAQADPRAYLDGIDLADRRKGWWLSLAGSISFNMIALSVLVIVVLVWRGFL
jgi:hypothetical protein